jgi:hypothetical protein
MTDSGSAETSHSQRIEHSLLVSALRLDAKIHDLVPILAGENLKDGQQCDRECVEVCRWCAIGKVKLSTEQLHAEQCKDENEQEEQEQQ